MILSPASARVPGETIVKSKVPVFSRVMDGTGGSVFVSELVEVMAATNGGLPLTVAVLVNVPASTSACVRVYVPVK